MPEREQLEELIVRAVLEALAAERPGWRLVELSLSLVCQSGVTSHLTLKPGQGFAVPPAGGQTDADQTDTPDRPAGTRQRILDALAAAAGPLKGEAVARRAGKRYNGYFREVLAGMVRDGLLVRTDEGYRLPARPADTPDTPPDADTSGEQVG